MAAPNKLNFISDGNVAVLDGILETDGKKKLPEPKYVYRYIVSNTKLGLTVSFTETQLQFLYKNLIAVAAKS